MMSMPTPMSPVLMEHIERSLEIWEQAEAAARRLLAQTDPYGRASWDTARWEEMLEHLSALHTRGQALRARLSAQQRLRGRATGDGRQQDARRMPRASLRASLRDS